MNQNFTITIIIGIIILITVLYKLVKPILMGNYDKNGQDLFISPEDIYEQVRIAISNGNHSLAQKLAKKYLRENPKHDRLRTILARSYYDTGSFSEAIEHLEILKTVFPARTDLLQMLANAYQKTSQNSNAIDIYLELLEDEPNSVDILTSLAELYKNVNHKKSALNIYKRLLSLELKESDKVNHYYNVAIIYKELGEFQNAIDYVDMGLNVANNNIQLLYLYRDLCSLTKNKEKEIEIMNKLLVLAPTDAYLQLDLINLYYKLEMYQEALDIAIPALNTPSTDLETLQNLIANIYIKTDRIEDSIKVLEEIMATYPESIKLTETLAYAYKLNNRYEDSIKMYNKLIDWSDLKTAKHYNFELSTLYCDWGVLLYNDKNSNEAFTRFEEALKINPDNPHIYKTLGQVNFIAKNYNDAIKQMQKAIELDERNYEYYMLLADIYNEIDNIYDAELMYREAIELNPENSECKAKLGIIKTKQKDIPAALEQLTAAIKLAPDNWDYMYNLALVYELAGNFDQAIVTYKKILELNPEHTESIKNLQILNNSK